MAMIEKIELPGTGIVIGYDPEAGETGQIQILWNDEVTETFDVYDSVTPPCCSACIENEAWVELDGFCPHGRMAYTRKVGLI